MNTRTKVYTEWTVLLDGQVQLICHNYFQAMDLYFDLKHKYGNDRVKCTKEILSKEVWCHLGRDIE